MLKILKSWFIELPIEGYKGIRDAKGIKNKLFSILIYLFVQTFPFFITWLWFYELIYVGLVGDDTELKVYSIIFLTFTLSIGLAIPFLNLSEWLKKKGVLSSKYANWLRVLPALPSLAIWVVYSIFWLLGLLFTLLQTIR